MVRGVADQAGPTISASQALDARVRRGIADSIRAIRRAEALDARSGRRVADRFRGGTVAIRQTFDADMADCVAERRVTTAITIRAARSVRHAITGCAVEISVSALATTAYRVTAWVREDGRTVVAFQVGVGAALVTGQVDIEIAVLTECGAVGAIAADRLSAHLTWREASGYGDCCAPEHPLENAAPINANREVFDEPIKTTAIHPSASLRCARHRRTEPPPHGRQAYDNRVAPFDRNVQVYLARCTYTYTVNMQGSAASVTSQSVTVASQTIAEARVHQGMCPPRRR